jgi:hypothetical protein
MSKIGYWTTDQIADELKMSRQFVIDAITGRSPYKLQATKLGRMWVIAEADAKSFIERVNDSSKEFYSPNDIAIAIGKSRPYVLDALTGYGGRKLPPRLKGEKRGDRWVIEKGEAERFIGLHGKGEG